MKHMKKRIGIFISTATILAMMMLAPVVAAVEPTTVGTVTADVLNVRSGPGTSNSKVGYITEGQTVTVLEHSDGWYKITYSGKTGYVAEGFLNVIQTGGSGNSDVTSMNKTAVVNATLLNVRSGSSSSHSMIGTLAYGKKVAITGSTNGWYQISFDGKTGYVASEFLLITEDDTSSTPTPTPTPPTDDAKKTGIVIADVLNIRLGAGTSHNKIGTVYSGNQLSILSTENGWYQVSYDGKTGYVSAEFVKLKEAVSETPAPPATPETPVADKNGTVTANVLNVRSGAGTTHSKIDTLFAGKVVKLTASSNGWYQISYDGKSGYVSAEYIEIATATPPTDVPPVETPSTSKTGVVNVTSLNVRSGAGTSYDQIGMIYSGKQLTILSTVNGWHQISFNGKTGYVSAEFIDLHDGSATTPPQGSTQVEKLLNAARGELGYVEAGDGYTKYGAWYGLPRTAWCAMFASWCADQAAIPTNILPKHAACAAGVSWFQQNGRWHGRDGYQPKPGDLIYFTVSHVGIVESVSDTKVTTLEGNTTSSVRRRTYNLNYATIKGYGSPNYTE